MSKVPLSNKILLTFTLPMYRVLRNLQGNGHMGPTVERLLREHREVKAKAKEMGVKIPKREANMRGKNRGG